MAAKMTGRQAISPAPWAWDCPVQAPPIAHHSSLQRMMVAKRYIAASAAGKPFADTESLLWDRCTEPVLQDEVNG